MGEGTFRRLRDDLADARRSFGGPLLPQRPHADRTALRMRAEAAYRSEPFQRAYDVVAGAIAALPGRRDDDLPPRRLQRTAAGGGDFRAIGASFHRHFVDLGGLEPGHDVLDVGCGAGRMAYAMTGWLEGRYEGFDVMPEAIDWARDAIGSRFPNFDFQLADVASERYNPRGRQSPADYRFPYDDASFDFTFATSVFTHLASDAVANYLGEIARVLRPGGRLLATYFLMNDEAIRLAGGHGQFSVDRGDHLVVDERVPERAVAIREEAVRGMHDERGLPIDATHYGSWCGRERFTSFQDITVSVRTPR